jgi:hypothetical protein
MKINGDVTAKIATDQQAATYVLSLVRASLRRDHVFIDELLAAAEPVSVVRALLGFASMNMIAMHGSPDKAVAKIDEMMSKANGKAAPPSE